MLEVEVKAKVSSFPRIKKKLDELGAIFVKTEVQEDIYFAHPMRDFSATDEAFRVRKVNNNYFLTYKGHRVDSETKTREEIEVSVEKGIVEILGRLGFSTWKKVKKEREIYNLGDMTVCLDDVHGLGKFIEIETNNYGKKREIFELLEKLEIDRKDCITRSYAEMCEV